MRPQISLLFEQKESSYRTIATTAQESSVQPAKQTQPVNANLPTPEFVSLAILGTLSLLYVYLSSKNLQPKEIHTPCWEAKKIPCKRCQFYSPNRYLPCAVQPFKALGFDAIHCPDYRPKLSKI